MIGSRPRRRSGRSRSRIRACSRIGAVRYRSQRRRMRDRLRSHRAFRIQQVVVARAQAQADQRTRIGYRFRLPAVIRLIAAHGVFARLVPGPGRFAAQVMFANQSFLNLLRPLRIDLLLAPRSRFLLTSLVRAGALRAAFVGRGSSIRFCLRFHRVAARLRSGSSGGVGRLRQRRARRCASTDQRYRAACTQPTPHSRATLLHAFQRQASVAKNAPHRTGQETN
jgi:hypothetical protein